MPKSLFILFFVTFITLGYAQKSTLLQNINFRAKELKHSLNTNGDSLLLEGERTIYSVEIFNQDFEKKIEVNSNKTKISLKDTPLGRFVVQAKLEDKKIIMTLLRHKVFDEKPISETIETIEEPSSDFSNSILKDIEDSPTKEALFPEPRTPKFENRHADLLSGKRLKHITSSKKTYWIKYEILSGSSYTKTMSLVNQDLVEKVIKKHNLELKTKQGEHNRLVVWEIFDSTRFMKLQLSDPEYISSAHSEVFNVKPYFTSKKTLSKSL